MAKSYKAYGEIEITDISDSKQLTSLIESKLQRQVIYDPNDKVYLPNFSTNNNVLSPQLFITGNMDNIVTQAKSVNWFYQVNSIGTRLPITGNTTDYSLDVNTKKLTIKNNVLKNNITMNYIVEIVYTDPDTDMDVKTVSQIELVKITNGINGVDGDNPIVAVLSNDSHIIPSDANGLNMNFTGASTEIKVYDGITDVTSSWAISALASTGVIGNMSSASGYVYTTTNLTVDSGYVDFTATNGTITLKKRFTLTKARKGNAGEDGRTPVKGTDYFDGINGQDGKSSYLWIMYSQNANGSGMVDSSVNAKYVGIATTQTNTKPSSYANYSWSLIKGTDGIKGETGANGKTSYLHIKYSDNGTSFTSNNGETMGSWMGTYVDFIEADSSVFSAYSWVKIKGETGEQGLRGLQGPDGAQGIAGPKGTDGKTSYTHIAYANSADGTLDFSTFDSLGKTYIGMYTDFTEEDSSNPSQYNWTLIKGADGAQGIQGPKGTDGRTPYLHIAYANSVNGSVGFSTTDSIGRTYIGQYTNYVQADSNTPSDYKWTLIKGADGNDAQILYLSSDAEAMTFDGLNNPSPNNQVINITAKLQNITGIPAFVASPYNQAGTKLADITLGGTGNTRTLTSAQWLNTFSKVVVTATLGNLTDKITIVKLSSGTNGKDGLNGLDGTNGIAGKDGVNSYTHIAYANNATGTIGFSTSDGLNKTHIGMYTDNVLSDSSDPAKYKWTLIKGADGTQGIQGPKGADGQTPYFHIAYATNATGTTGFSTSDSVDKTYIGQYTDYVQADSSTPSKYSWTKIRGEDGYTPIKGTDYFDGRDGANGQSSYLWVAYSQNANGNPMTDNPSGAKYLGVATTSSATRPTSYTSYTWTLIKGTDGIKGETGSDGKTSYMHIKYSNDGGITFTSNNGESVGDWIGTYVDFIEADSNSVGAYTWNKVKGEKGDVGPKGATGEQGPRGNVGTSISSVTEHYLATASSTGVTTSTVGWTSTIQTITVAKKYLWNYEKINFSDGTFQNTIPVIIGVYGDTGQTGPTGSAGNAGVDGRSIVGLTEYYLASNSATGVTRTTSGWTTAVQVTTPEKKYLWNYEAITWSANPTTTYVEPIIIGVHGERGPEGSQGIQGPKGTDGQTSYTHIAYANNATGTSGFSVSDSVNKLYVGMYTDFIANDSSEPTKYKWTLIKGADGSQGIQGPKGTDGQTPYFHIAYANNATGSVGFSTTDGSGKSYIGQYTDYTSADSNDPTKYSWTLIKGSDGSNGIDAIVGYLTNESITIGASSTGVVNDFSVATGTFKVFDGTVEKTGSAVVYAKVSNTGCTAAINANGVYSVSAMTSDTATVVMTATYKSVVITKTLVLAKSKTGSTGESATAYWLTNSVGIIKRNDAGVYVPTTITVNALSQKGSGAPSAYAGRFIISETSNGTTWTDKYTSSANESSKTYTPSANITAVRVRMYLAGGVTSLVDEQNIPVVADGSDPIIAIASTPLGSIIKNSTGNLTVEANLYKGGNIINATSYKWFKLDTSVAGGWRQLTVSVPDGTTGYSTKTLTVTPSAIVSVSTFKVEAIYNGVSYTDMVTLSDLSDPISAVIIGSGIYKNGQGTNSYTARLYQNGKEIDVNGTIYLYKWNLLNSDGTLNNSFTATGKSISVPAIVAHGTVQLKCDVDDRK